MIKKLKPIYFTEEGLDKVKQEYENLQKSRPEAVQTLKKARELGDLSENGFYKAARARLSSIDNRLFQLEMMIKLARVRQPSGEGVQIGSKVLLSDGKITRTLQIVGDFETDPINNKISTKSPLGRAIIGRKIGDQVTITTPKGALTYKIEKIIN